MMYDARLSSGLMTGYEADLWVDRHGDLRTSFDRLVEVAPPAPGAVILGLVPGQTMMVAMNGPGELDNQFWIECTETSTYRAFSMRPKDSDATALTRYEEKYVGEFDSADGVFSAPSAATSVGRPTGRSRNLIRSSPSAGWIRPCPVIDHATGWR